MEDIREENRTCDDCSERGRWCTVCYRYGYWTESKDSIHRRADKRIAELEAALRNQAFYSFGPGEAEERALDHTEEVLGHKLEWRAESPYDEAAGQ